MLKEALTKTPRLKFWLTLSALATLLVLEIVMTCLIPEWREYFYNVLQNKDQALFATSLWAFAGLMAGLGIAQGLKVWVGQLTSFQLRTAATAVLFKRWVKGPRQAKNYTQAMTEALRNSTELYLEIVVEVIISAAIVVVLIISNLHNPLILAASLIYTLTITGAALLFNKPMFMSDKIWQAAEGELRECFSDIANGNGDYSYKEKLQRVIVTYYRYIRVVMYFTLFSRMKSALSAIIPYILLAGPYFSGTITLGVFMAGVATFELIVINATIIIMLYPKLTKARASYQLSKEFYEEVKSHDKFV